MLNINVFNLKNLKEEELLKLNKQLYNQFNLEAISPYHYAQNVEVLADVLMLLGEFIARYQEAVTILKYEIEERHGYYVRINRQDWCKLSNEKAPSITYFEALANEKLLDKRKELAQKEANLKRFNLAYSSTEQKLNAVKKKMESIKYEGLYE